MTLKQYKEKRNLKKTPEPKAEVEKKPRIPKARKLIFVVHKHSATHLHWDLRLEMNGVLKSWAVPKQPPKVKGEKRLAIQVEDHPLDYAFFKGIIPEGHYGAGKVEIWDKGNYELVEKDSEKIIFELHGKKLKGKYVLIKTGYGGKKKGWLFFKI